MPPAKRSSTSSTSSSAKPAAKRAAPASEAESLATVAAQLAKGVINPRDLVMLTRELIQETLDDAAARGRVTRKDANELVSELLRRGRQGGDEMVGDVESLLGKGQRRLGSATKRARGSEPVDRLVRGADRARRAAGVGPTFPIIGYDELNVAQVQSRLKELSQPELRKVLDYERKTANRKSVVGAIEKSLP